MHSESLSLKTQYWDNPEARNAFKAFMATIHGLDFSEWESNGYWDYAYTPFSFFEGEKILSSMCVYSLDAVINGEKARLAQISGVGTLPEWRRKGLGRRLNDIALAWADNTHSGVFLFADPDAAPFYKACSFTPIQEYLEYTEASGTYRTEGAIKLNPGQPGDLEKIYNHAKQRAPISDRFSILNEYLLMFHTLYKLRNQTYEIEDLNCVVFFEREKEYLKIYDIVGKTIPKLSDLYPYIADKNDKIIEFHFYADKLGCNPIKTKPIEGSHTFVKTGFPFEKPVFPFTSKA